MQVELYNKLFARMDELGAIRKDLSLGCEIETCECNDWCCGIEEWVVGEKYWKCTWEKTSYIWAKFEINVMSVKWHPPVLSDCIRWCESVFPWSRWYTMTQAMWDFRKPHLHQQSDELGEKLFTLLK